MRMCPTSDNESCKNFILVFYIHIVYTRFYICFVRFIFIVLCDVNKSNITSCSNGPSLLNPTIEVQTQCETSLECLLPFEVKQ